MRNLREIIETDIFDYLQLTAALSEYSNVRCKIGRMLSNGEIIRLRKGLYTFPAYMRKHPLNSGIVASMLHGPSYLSLDYALSFWGMIPESVCTVTSVTTTRPRVFLTPVGRFEYLSMMSEAYSIGVMMIEAKHGNFLMATKEKALFDKAYFDRRFTGDGIEDYLFEDLRIDSESLFGLDCEVLTQLQMVARGRMKKFVSFLQRIQDGTSSVSA
ncbi:MAG: hypothetical protein MJ106_06320 [Lentisphaeria bacterium]|nr:hypothetical protein [Lentisphaeria bacterium]